jgi:hypothetical protein
MTDLHFKDGAWQPGTGLLAGVEFSGRAHDQVLEEDLGFRLWAQVGELPSAPLVLRVYMRAKTPQFLIDVEPGAAGSPQCVYAGELPDVMELLRQWAPVVQACTVAGLVNLMHDPREG